MIRSILQKVSLVRPQKFKHLHLRRIVCQVQEEGDTLQRAVLLEIAGEETSSFQVNTHGSKDDGEILLMSIVCTLVRNTLLLYQTSLSTNLGGNLVMGKTSSREDGNLLATSNRVHRVNGGDASGNHFFGVDLIILSLDCMPVLEST